MSIVWRYFNKNFSLALCKIAECRFTKDLSNVGSPTNFIWSHLNSKHKIDYDILKEEKAKKSQSLTIIRCFKAPQNTSV